VSDYVADADFYWPAQFKADRYPGLLVCELHRRTGGTTRLLAYWRDGDAYTAMNMVLAKELGIATGGAALLVDVRPPAKKFWPTSAGDAVLKASALIGALTVVAGLATWLFAFPAVTLAMPDAQPANVVVGTPVDLRALVINNHRSTAADVALTVTSSTTRMVNADTPRLTIPGGGQANVKLTARFDQRNQQGAADHEVMLTAMTKAGLLIPAWSTSVTGRVRVWPQIAKLPQVTVDTSRTSTRAGFIQVNLAVGQGGGVKIRCSTTAVGVPTAVRFLSVSPSADGGGQPDESHGNGPRAIAILWETEFRQPFEWKPITLAMDSAVDQSPAAWAQIAATLDTSCEVVR
jgi:hypothetical protein